MTFAVTEKCIACRYTDCVEVCPVDAFREGPNALVIDPDICIDCALCEPECPIQAIVPEESASESILALNQRLASKWPVITHNKGPLPEAERYKDETDKLSLLIE